MNHDILDSPPPSNGSSELFIPQISFRNTTTCDTSVIDNSNSMPTPKRRKVLENFILLKDYPSQFEDSDWTHIESKGKNSIWSHFLEGKKDRSTLKCTHCNHVFRYNRRKAPYNIQPAENHLRYDCTDPDYFHGNLKDERIIKEICEKKQNKYRNLKQYIKTQSFFDLAVELILESRLSINWVESSVAKNLWATMALIPIDNTSKPEQVLKPNKSNITNFICTKSKDINYFWKSEIASSAYILNEKTFTKRNKFLVSLTKRLYALDNVTFMSLVFDHWSNHKMSNYLGVLLVTYDEEEGKQIPFLVKMDRSDSHKKIDISQQLGEIFSKFDGLRTVTVGMSTDNVANMLKVPREFTRNGLLSSHFLGDVPCLLHSPDIMNSTLLDMVEEDGLGPVDSKHESELLELAAIKYQLNSDGSRNNILKQDIFTNYLLSNSSQLSSEPAETGGLLSFITDDIILKKNNQLAHAIKSNHVNQLLYRELCIEFAKMHEDEPLALKTYSKSKWLSAVDVLLRLRELKLVLMELNEEPSLGVFFEEEDFVLIDDLTDILSPFHSLCEMLSNGTCTIKNTLPMLISYKDKIDKMFAEKSRSCSPAYRHLPVFIRFKRKIDKYYKKYVSMDNCLLSSYLNIAFVDSSVFIEQFPRENTEIKKSDHVISVVSRKLTDILIPFLNISYYPTYDSDTEDIVGNSSHAERVYDAEGYLSEGQKQENLEFEGEFDEFSIKDDLHKRIRLELERYRLRALSLVKEYSNEVLSKSNKSWSKFNRQVQVIVGADRIFWSRHKREFPLLSLANRLFHCIPSTSILTERLFCLASQIYDKRKNQLSDQTFEDLCIIRSFLLRIKSGSINITDCTLKDALRLTKELNME
ncbi:hypothetical protein NCAS_0D04560 [Naumovozyma castellii]|uniref:HAT C-terminal dimerisation domain-containing protein n=1 Tax=Naumovozyma castellii TaxID=27288 RepID=G0VEP6_NAUCA|nr:hypothetical protein NCAS_0D04560 [Naumovozyma castellii CBS 4309]CCC70037.1 hypothetical protein NCAS_0D04560 [Naumovozyma castellii CBS 4309]